MILTAYDKKTRISHAHKIRRKIPWYFAKKNWGNEFLQVNDWGTEIINLLFKGGNLSTSSNANTENMGGSKEIFHPITSIRLPYYYSNE